MCQAIWDRVGKRHIHTLRELLDVAPRASVVIGEHYCKPGQSRDEFINNGLDCCLCPIDLEATFADVSGLSLHPTGTIPEYELRSESSAGTQE